MVAVKDRFSADINEKIIQVTEIGHRTSSLRGISVGPLYSSKSFRLNDHFTVIANQVSVDRQICNQVHYQGRRGIYTTMKRYQISRVAIKKKKKFFIGIKCY